MRATLLTAAFAAGLAGLLGCTPDAKRKLLAPPTKEEVRLPPDDKRYNEPPTEDWKPPPPKKADTSLTGKDRGGVRGPMGPGL
jgi:hypothetical protein